METEGIEDAQDTVMQISGKEGSLGKFPRDEVEGEWSEANLLLKEQERMKEVDDEDIVANLKLPERLPSKKREFSVITDDGVAIKATEEEWGEVQSEDYNDIDEEAWLLEQMKMYKPPHQPEWAWLFENGRRRGPDGKLLLASYHTRNHWFTHWRPHAARQKENDGHRGCEDDCPSDSDGEDPHDGYRQTEIPASFLEPIPYSQEELDEIEERRLMLAGLSLKDEMDEGIF